MAAGGDALMLISSFEPSTRELNNTIETPSHPLASNCSSISQFKMLQKVPFLKSSALIKLLARVGMKLAVTILKVVAILMEIVEG